MCRVESSRSRSSSRRHASTTRTEPRSLGYVAGRDLMNDLGVVIDVAAGTCHVRALGLGDVPMLRTDSGHLAVKISEYIDSGFPKFTGTPATETYVLVHRVATDGRVPRRTRHAARDGEDGRRSRQRARGSSRPSGARAQAVPRRPRLDRCSRNPLRRCRSAAGTPSRSPQSDGAGPCSSARSKS